VGHQVKVAADGEKGLEAARSFHPDVILCDIGLPGKMDGYAVARAFKQDPLLAPGRLVAVSGYSHREAVEKCWSAGFDLYLKKPIEAEQLEEILSTSFEDALQG
jgi:CheY-like chemotaxis protein